MTQAGITGMMRRTGYLRLYRDEKGFDAAVREDEKNKTLYGVNAKTAQCRAGIAELEPHIKPVYAGGAVLGLIPSASPIPVRLAKPMATFSRVVAARWSRAKRGR